MPSSRKSRPGRWRSALPFLGRTIPIPPKPGQACPRRTMARHPPRPPRRAVSRDARGRNIQCRRRQAGGRPRGPAPLPAGCVLRARLTKNAEPSCASANTLAARQRGQLTFVSFWRPKHFSHTFEAASLSAWPAISGKDRLIVVASTVAASASCMVRLTEYGSSDVYGLRPRTPA